MTETLRNFTPYETIPLTLTASTSGSQKFALPGSTRLMDCQVYNAGTVVAFVAFGNSSKGAVTATIPGTTGTINATPVPPGACMVLDKNANIDNGGADTVAAYSTGTPTLYFTSGTGS